MLQEIIKQISDEVNYKATRFSVPYDIKFLSYISPTDDKSKTIDYTMEPKNHVTISVNGIDIAWVSEIPKIFNHNKEEMELKLCTRLIKLLIEASIFTLYNDKKNKLEKHV